MGRAEGRERLAWNATSQDESGAGDGDGSVGAGAKLTGRGAWLEGSDPSCDVRRPPDRGQAATSADRSEVDWTV